MVFPRVQYWGQFCLTLFINNPDEGAQCALSKSADSTKLDETVNLVEVRKALQRDQWDKSNHMTYTRCHSWVITTPCSAISLGKSGWKVGDIQETCGHGTKGHSLVMGLGKEQACGGGDVIFFHGEKSGILGGCGKKSRVLGGHREEARMVHVLRKMFQI